MQSIQPGLLTKDRRLAAEDAEATSTRTDERLPWPHAALFVLGASVVLWFALGQMMVRIIG